MTCHGKNRARSQARLTAATIRLLNSSQPLQEGGHNGKSQYSPLPGGPPATQSCGAARVARSAREVSGRSTSTGNLAAGPGKRCGRCQYQTHGVQITASSYQSKVSCIVRRCWRRQTSRRRLRSKSRGLPEEASAGPGSADLREAERGERNASNNSSDFAWHASVCSGGASNI